MIKDTTPNHVYRHRGESGTQALIQGVSKLIHNDGVGCPGEISSYLREQGVMKMPVHPFIGNRFNILFVNAAGKDYNSIYNKV